MTTTLNPGSMSSFTRGLHDYQREFYKEAAEDRTFGGVVKTNLVGRVITLGISLVLHAEAVCRAVIICFLSIKETFTKSSDELMAKQKQECSLAYSESLKSFIALFHRQILTSTIDSSQEAPAKLPQIIVEENPIIVQVADQPAPVQLQIQAPGENLQAVIQPEPVMDQPLLGAAPAINQELLVEEPLIHIDLGAIVDEHFPDQEPPIEEFVQVEAPAEAEEDDLELVENHALVAAAEEQFDEHVVVEMPGNPAPLLVAQHEPLEEAVLVEAEPQPDPQLPLNLAAGLPLQAAGDGSDSEFELVEEEVDPLALAVILPQPQANQPAIVLPAALALAPPAKPEAPDAVYFALAELADAHQAPLTPDEEYRLKHEMEREDIRKQTFKSQMEVLDSQTVVAALAVELIDATSQVAIGEKNIKYIVGPEADYQDPRWKFNGGFVGPHAVGICHFANGQHILGAQHLATRLTLSISGKEHHAPLFGIFDPQIGSRASQFLVHNLPKVMSEHLNFFNKDGLSQEGIWNAISLAFLKLNSDFIKANKSAKIDRRFNEVIADHGSSAAVIMMLHGSVWVAHLGNSRAALDNGGAPIQMTTDADPKNPKYEQLVRSLGGDIDDNGLVNGRLNMATGFGHYYLRGAISSKPSITQFRLDRIKPGSHLIIGTYGLFEATSTRRVTSWLHDHRNLDARNLAHDVVYSIFRANQDDKRPRIKERPLSSLVIGINAMPDDWEEV